MVRLRASALTLVALVGAVATGAFLGGRGRRAERGKLRSEPETESDAKHSAFAGIAVATVAAALTVGAFVGSGQVRAGWTKTATASAMTRGDPDRAPAIFRRYGCTGCHTIPGVPGADGQTGAPLGGLSKRVYIAGVLENRPDNLIAWIRSPQSISPQTAMPDTGISEAETRDLAAYLYAL